jgi:hypothetical protein
MAKVAFSNKKRRMIESDEAEREKRKEKRKGEEDRKRP